MPSHSLLEWQNERVPRLDALEAQCLALALSTTSDPRLVDENLRGLVVLLSAHFQGFCRDLHTECVQILARTITPPIKLIFQALCSEDLALDSSNARYENIKSDFERFGFDLTQTIRVDPNSAPTNDAFVTDINHLNSWRNYVAHSKRLEPAHGGPLEIQRVQKWRTSCDGFASLLDGIMYNELQNISGIAPW